MVGVREHGLRLWSQITLKLWHAIWIELRYEFIHSIEKADGFMPFPSPAGNQPRELGCKRSGRNFSCAIYPFREGSLIFSHGRNDFSTSGLEIAVSGRIAQMTRIKDSDTIKSFPQTSIIVIRIALQFWIYCPIIVEGACVLRICIEY